ncbi:sulfatase [Zavarzinella formosa]|uniref:sulfatase n=1 Tax=Zavarzinella formosa TaxID=360055 RepID=UPI00030E8E6E|nr:sulfatase [Zavarzinella formosa]
MRLSLSLLMALTLSLSLSAADRPPNIVLILADDLGNNDLGCDGRKDHATPNLDQLAKDGIRYTASYSAAPLCSATRAALMTGKSPARLHITSYLPGRADAPSQAVLQPKMSPQLPLEEITIAERLKAAGYATACIGKWHLGGAGFGPEKQGFDTVFAGNAQTKPSDTEAGKGEYGLTEKAEAFMEANREKPFFLYLAHNNPHIPLAARPELMEKFKDSFNPTYAAMVNTLDDSVGRILKKLDDLKLANETLVVFTSDNGGLHVPELKDDAPTHNALRAGKGFLYEGGIRVPLIVRWPGHIKPGTECKTPVISTDLPLTFCGVAGVKIADPLDGLSLLPVFAGKDIKERSLFWHFPHYSNQGGRPSSAVRRGHWKLIEYVDQPERELYDLETNPLESPAGNMAGHKPELVAELVKALDEFQKSAKAQTVTPNPAWDEKQFDKFYRQTDVTQPLKGNSARTVSEPLREWRRLIDEAVKKEKK